MAYVTLPSSLLEVLNFTPSSEGSTKSPFGSSQCGCHLNVGAFGGIVAVKWIILSRET